MPGNSRTAAVASLTFAATNGRPAKRDYPLPSMDLILVYLERVDPHEELDAVERLRRVSMLWQADELRASGLGDGS